MHVLSKKLNICINKITIKPPYGYSAYNNVTYFRWLGKFDMGRSI